MSHCKHLHNIRALDAVRVRKAFGLPMPIGWLLPNNRPSCTSTENNRGISPEDVTMNLFSSWSTIAHRLCKIYSPLEAPADNSTPKSGNLLTPGSFRLRQRRHIQICRGV